MHNSIINLVVTNPTAVAAGCLALLVLWLTYNRYGRGLNHIPGPFLATTSNLWRLLVVWKRRPELTHIALHQRHGPLVRLGPNVVSCSSASAVPVIYALNAGFVKSDFYAVQQTLANGHALFTLFTSLDEKFHARLRRAVSSAYAMSSLVAFEPYVDSTTRAFFAQLDARFAATGGAVCDLGTWLQYYAFDVVGELTYSKRLGFVDTGRDVEGIIASIERMLDYAAVVGQMPWLDRLLLKKNPVTVLLGRLGLIGGTTPMVTFARARLAERVDPATGREKPSLDSGASSVRRDFLSRFLEAQRKDPDFVTDQRVLALTVANIFAGSDTTAISLRAVFYYLLRNPDDLDRLRKELQALKTSRPDEDVDELTLFTWSETRELPFLDAVIKEALRVHPATGLPLERIVPPRGVTVCGQFVPGGTILGCNAWTVHGDTAVFGADAATWRPARWLEASEQQRRLMETCLFSFGAGARTCIGRNISLLEMYKLVPAMVMRYQIELADPGRPWKLHNAWFVKQSDFYVKFSRREEQP